MFQLLNSTLRLTGGRYFIFGEMVQRLLYGKGRQERGDKVDRDRLYDFFLFDDIGFELNFSLNVYETQYFERLAAMHAPFAKMC